MHDGAMNGCEMGERFNPCPAMTIRKSGACLSGPLIGGIAETQELLHFCACSQIHPEVELTRMNQINDVFKRLERAEVRYRFVIDMASHDAAMG